jgi:molybdate transport system regulatory protein
MNALKIRLRIDFDESNAIGPGKIALLERMRDSGSLSQAARELNMSYRRAWQLLASLNASFREPVIVTSIGGKGGGGTAITELGQSLIDSYRALENEMTRKANQYFKPVTAQIAAPRGAVRRPITKSARPRPAPQTRGRGSKRP